MGSKFSILIDIYGNIRCLKIVNVSFHFGLHEKRKERERERDGNLETGRERGRALFLGTSPGPGGVPCKLGLPAMLCSPPLSLSHFIFHVCKIVPSNPDTL